MKFTVLGGSGFIGSHLARHLREQGHECFVPERGSTGVFSQPLGHVLYCIGLTSDFRRRPHDTVEAHVCLLNDVLRRADFESLLYLSSTRVYIHSGGGAEADALAVHSGEAEDLFNLSKLTGESLCLHGGHANVRVARLSNVYGPDWGARNFLMDVIRDAVEGGRITLRSALASAKDYVSLTDVVEILPRIATHGRQSLYNVASGRNVSHGEIMEILRQLTGCAVDVEAGAPVIKFPALSITRLREEFGYAPRWLEDDLPALVQEFRP